MPTYQYRCTECGEELEVVQKFSDDPLTECPACQGRLRKLFSPVGVVFKGSGFYKTDSRSSSTGASARKETSTTDGGSGSTDSATKPAESGAATKSGGDSSPSGSTASTPPTGDKVA
jgi:putative FmdB family regulatory protein